MLDYDRIKNWQLPELTLKLRDRELILYALAVGYGGDPLDQRQLPFVYEAGLTPTPTFASVLGYPGFWMKAPEAGLDWVHVVHAEECITLHRPLPESGEFTAHTYVDAIVDKGPNVGAIVYQRRAIRNVSNGDLVATVDHATFCRRDGGFGGGDDPRPRPKPTPNRRPDETCDLPTLRQSALLFRLLGDRNPLHADPGIARAAGYSSPILHGLATYGTAGHAVLRTCCDYDPTRITSIFARFASPVYPGETIRTELWRSDNDVRFRAIALERGVVVLTHGHAVLSS